MPGGTARSAAPRELADDPDRWPDAVIADGAARVVQHVARAAGRRIAQLGLSLRAVESATGVSRMSVAALMEGSSWPDLLTVVSLEDGLDCPLWPGSPGLGSAHAMPFEP